jgi:hypothetical protein
MSWAQIEKKHHEKYKREFILCREPEERNFIINSILESFTFIKREEIEKTFEHFCQTSVQPTERELFLARIKEHLGREITSNYVKRYTFF